MIFYLKIFGDLRFLLYLCVQKINEGPASDEFSLVGDGHFFVYLSTKNRSCMGNFGVRPYAEQTRQNRYLFNKYSNED